MNLPKRILDPAERIAEILFGLIMALTCTGAIGVVTADQFQIRTMLIGALGCNVAWGIIDGGMYLMARLAERGSSALLLQKARDATDSHSAYRAIEDALPPQLAAALDPAQLELIRQRLRQMPELEIRSTFIRRDFLGALGVCILVIVTTFPVALPFVMIGDPKFALRISNTIAVTLLFLCGFLFARHAGLRPLATGLIMVFIGAALVSIAIALGG